MPHQPGPPIANPPERIVRLSRRAAPSATTQERWRLTEQGDRLTQRHEIGPLVLFDVISELSKLLQLGATMSS